MKIILLICVIIKEIFIGFILCGLILMTIIHYFTIRPLKQKELI